MGSMCRLVPTIPQVWGSLLLTFSRTSRTVAPAKRRHVGRRVRPRARPASAGRALELSGCETA
eukprot:7266409-Prymnesium_polylepis.1